MGMALGAIGLFGSAISAVGSYESAQANAATAAYQAQVAQNNATIARQNASWSAEAGAAKEAAQGMKNAAQVGQLKAKQAASGVDLTSGSSANVAASASELGELDLGTTRSNTSRNVYGYEVEATNDVAQSQLLQTESQNYSAMAPIGALGTFLSGASSVGSRMFNSGSGFGGSSGGSGVAGF